MRNEYIKHRNVISYGGYIALTTVLVVGVALLMIGLSVSLVAISEGQLSLSSQRNETVLDVTESCVEDALLRINKTNTLPSSIVLPEGTCSIVIDSHVGNNWTVTITSSSNTLTKKIQISAVRASTVTLMSWLEI